MQSWVPYYASGLATEPRPLQSEPIVGSIIQCCMSPLVGTSSHWAPVSSTTIPALAQDTDLSLKPNADQEDWWTTISSLPPSIPGSVSPPGAIFLRVIPLQGSKAAMLGLQASPRLMLRSHMQGVTEPLNGSTAAMLGFQSAQD